MYKLRRWSAATDPKCALCGWKNVGHVHILCGCTKALDQGRVSFRHDSVLKVIKDWIESKCKEVKKAVPAKDVTKIGFVKKGAAGKRKKEDKCGILDSATDWVVQMDTRAVQVPFPPHILVTKHRPDIVVSSESTKQVLMLELTSPAEENMEKWRIDKMVRYEPLVEAVRDKGVWKPRLWTVEVGARGFVGNGAARFAQQLGIKKTSDFVRDLSRMAIRCSHFIWINRESQVWASPRAM